MNEKVPLEQAKVFRAVDPEKSYSAYNAEKLVTFKLINGLAQVIPVTVVAKDLMAMLPLINEEISYGQKVENVENNSFWASIQNPSIMTESNQLILRVQMNRSILKALMVSHRPQNQRAM